MSGRNWILTINNPTIILEDLWKEETMNYLCGQLEKGESGTPHFQVFINYKQPVRMASVMKLVKCHAELAKNPLAAIKYCKKEDTRVEGPWEYGTYKKSGERGKAATSFKDIKEMSKEERLELAPCKIVAFDRAEAIVKKWDYTPATLPRKVIWIYGESGVGKSRYVRTHYPNAYTKQQNKWWEFYNNEKVVHLEDFDMHGACLSHYLKLWADPWAPEILAEIKGTSCQLGYETFIVTSQYTIGQIWPESNQQEIRDALSRRFEFLDFNSNPPIFT